MLQNQLANYGDKMFDKDTAKIVRRHAFWAAIILALPLFGLDVIVFAIILWHMYSSWPKEPTKDLIQEALSWVSLSISWLLLQSILF